jgi:hypothetical protein
MTLLKAKDFLPAKTTWNFTTPSLNLILFQALDFSEYRRNLSVVPKPSFLNLHISMHTKRFLCDFFNIIINAHDFHRSSTVYNQYLNHYFKSL